MHFACGEIDVRGLWCKIEKLIIFGRFKPNGVQNRWKVDDSGSNALVHASVDVLGVDFENANRPHSSQRLPAPLGTLSACTGRAWADYLVQTCVNTYFRLDARWTLWFGLTLVTLG